MLNAFTISPGADIRQVIDTPEESEDIISVCDKLLTSLSEAETLANAMEIQLNKMKKLYPADSTL